MSDEGRLVAGRYRLVELVGRGGMGAVWRAEDVQLARQVALKRLHTPPHLSAAEVTTLYERIRREARSAARITHPNVVVVHDVVDDDGQPCIVMEYVSAGTLGDALADGRTLAPAEAARVGLGVISAVRAAHAVGVLHRDIKPGNVLLGADGRVVLTDFGIAQTAGTSTLTQTGEMIGSIDFMAPERVRGLRPGPASDLWSLGATLYQAVEGHLPYRRDTAMETAYAVAVDPPRPMRQAGSLGPLVEALLSKDPADRPTAEQTEQALRAIGSEVRPTVVAAAAEGARQVAPEGTRQVVPAAAPKRARRPKRRVLVTTATVLAAAAAAATLATASHQAGRDGAETGPSSPSVSPSPLPAGHHLVRDAQLDAAFPVPDGWKKKKGSSDDEVTYADPTGLAGVTVGMVDPAGAHPVGHFKDIEANTKANYPTYRRLRMQETDFRGQPAVVWDFTFHGRARLFRAVDLGYGTAGGREYDIYLSAPAARWDRYRPVFDAVRDGFTAKRG
ncbi:serine/threonine-protein kinase [Streptomyces sp. NPDC057616]|uniref:serine/threonine-protein kinase n=1 Tax=Streptomyces sp. NPDC057616 TaxID=3346183 RepID=UPI00367D7BDE